MSYSKKRRVHRIRLAPPILGRLGGQSVVVVDISLDGALVEHSEPVAIGSEAALSFLWEDDMVVMRSRVVRCKLERFAGSGGEGLTVFHSGLLFTEADASREQIKKMIAEHISRALDEQKANARGQLPVSLEHMPIFREHTLTANQDETAKAVGLTDQRPAARIARATGYICFRLDQNSWKRTRTNDPEQPPNGFTVSASEDLAQLEELCETYRRGDEPAREFIRLLARLSITEGALPKL
jgi:hypothetical protein